MGTFTVKKMALNTAHANGGVLIHAGESILLFCDNVTMEFSGQDGAEFKGSKQGRLYLTTHRMIFNNKKTDDKMVSFSYPGINGTNGYSNGAAGGGGAGGWTAPHANGSTRMTSAERKAAEASAPPVQTGYYDPNNPGQAYVPPPAYYNDPPPGYADTRDKKND